MIASFVLLGLVGVIGTSDALNAQLTHYCSYPPCCKSNPSPPYTSAEKKHCDTSECSDYSGCKWEGQFAFCGKKSHDWVIKNNVFALFSTHGDINKYKNKKIRVTQGKYKAEGIVCDSCSDSDCDGCCTRNAGSSGYLIDMDANTYQRFGGKDGPVTWTCLDC